MFEFSLTLFWQWPILSIHCLFFYCPRGFSDCGKGTLSPPPPYVWPRSVELLISLETTPNRWSREPRGKSFSLPPCSFPGKGTWSWPFYAACSLERWIQWWPTKNKVEMLGVPCIVLIKLTKSSERWKYQNGYCMKLEHVITWLYSLVRSHGTHHSLKQ